MIGSGIFAPNLAVAFFFFFEDHSVVEKFLGKIIVSTQ